MTKFPKLAIIFVIVALCGCTTERPQQIKFLLKTDSGNSHAVDTAVSFIAESNGMSVSSKDFDIMGNTQRNFEIYGNGISIFIQSLPSDNCAPAQGKPELTFSNELYSLNVVATDRTLPKAKLLEFSRKIRKLPLKEATIVEPKPTSIKSCE